MKSVPAKAIKNISPVRDFAFVDLVDHETAKKIKEDLNGQIISKTAVEIEFARPPSEDSIHSLRQTDFDQRLRLKCMANYWDMPIYLYGRVYEDKKIQNVCVIIKVGCEPHYYFCEINYTDLVDIQSRIAEVIVKMIDEFLHLPSEHLVIKVDKEYFAVGKCFYKKFYELILKWVHVSEEMRSSFRVKFTRKKKETVKNSQQI